MFELSTEEVTFTSPTKEMSTPVASTDCESQESTADRSHGMKDDTALGGPDEMQSAFSGIEQFKKISDRATVDSSENAAAMEIDSFTPLGKISTAIREVKPLHSKEIRHTLPACCRCRQVYNTFCNFS